MRVIARRCQAYASNSHIFLLWMAARRWCCSASRSCSCATRSGRSCASPTSPRASARAASWNSAPAAPPRGAQGRPRLHRDEAAHRAGDGAAHDDAQRRQPRPAHDPDPVPTLPRAGRADAGGRGTAARRRRDEPDAGGLPRLRPGRFPRAGGPDRPAHPAGGPAHRRRAPRRPCQRGHGRGPPDRDGAADAFRRCLFNLAPTPPATATRWRSPARLEARWLAVSIDDDGPGIPPDLREDVFKPFVRLDDARQDAGGSGLGLAIALDIARAHGGDVSLHDSVLGGLRATVRVPA